MRRQDENKLVSFNNVELWEGGVGIEDKKSSEFIMQKTRASN